jgi:hypothetical protein
VVVCPNCGTRNDAGSRFCGECGADLRALGTASPSPPPQPQAPGIPSSWGSPVPMQPEQPKGRRVWLWVSVGIICAFLLCCCLPLVWASTVGEDDFIDIQTRVSDWLTEVAPTPTPRFNHTDQS